MSYLASEMELVLSPRLISLTECIVVKHLCLLIPESAQERFPLVTSDDINLLHKLLLHFSLIVSLDDSRLNVTIVRLLGRFEIGRIRFGLVGATSLSHPEVIFISKASINSQHRFRDFSTDILREIRFDMLEARTEGLLSWAVDLTDPMFEGSWRGGLGIMGLVRGRSGASFWRSTSTSLESAIKASDIFYSLRRLERIFLTKASYRKGSILSKQTATFNLTV